VGRFRTALRWWIFLPFGPILLAFISKYSAKLFHQIGFHRLEYAADGLTALDAFALIPHMALDFALFGRAVGPVAPKGGSFLFHILLLSLPAAVLCLVLYGVSMVLQRRVTLVE
jgi:hypothetical protein